MDIPIISPYQTPMVFISSQIGVFSQERKELARLIKAELKFNTFLFESMSRPHPARDVYLAGIEQSQIFIGIYGNEYGWVDEENGMEISGIHDELLVAKSINKRRFAFILNSEKRDSRLTELIKNEVYDETATLFDNAEELYKKVITSLNTFAFECIFAGSESYEKIPDYASDLIERYNSKYIIETLFYRNELSSTIENNNKVYLYGEQGCGKTVALLLTAKKQNAIYISLRNRSLSNVLGYITNKILNILGHSSYKHTSIEDTSRKYEQLLRVNQVLLMIDDVDQNPEVAKYLFGLEIGKSKVIFSGRKCISDFDAVSVKCTGFTTEESKEYISNIVTHPNKIFQNEAIEKSRGNPQYLAYYCNNSNQKPADSLESYHEQIYAQLSPQSQEILAVLSISETILNIDKIAIILSKYRKQTITPIALSNELKNIDFLIAYKKDMVSILHPAFSEYVSQKLTSSGVSSGIHIAISEIYNELYEVHLKIYHVVCAGDGEKVYSDLPNAELNAYLSGFIRIARKLFTEDILISRRKEELFRLGYALYNAALLKRDQFGELAGLNTLLLAEKIFAKAKRNDWVKILNSIKATFLVNLGRGREAIDMLQKLATHFHDKGLIHEEAVIHTNLSYAYQKLGLIDKVESECLKAKELHETIGDDIGVAACLQNINIVYMATNKYDKILKNCREIQRFAKKIDSPRLEAGAQNGLTAYYRRKKLYDKAEEAARKSISLAKELNVLDLVAINYGNLGNVFRDQGKISDAKDCHEKVLDIGIKIKSKSHVAHAKGRLAEVCGDEDDGGSAIRYGYESIQIWKEIDNAYELASESCKQAERILKFAGFDWKKSIALYQDSIKYYLSAGLKKDAFNSYGELIDICKKHFDRFLTIEKVNEALLLFSMPEFSAFVNSILEELLKWDDKFQKWLDVNFVLQNSLKCISEKLSKSDLFGLVRNLTAILKLFGSSIENNYLILIEHLISIYKKEKYDHCITAIAIAIEQIPISIGEKHLTCIFEKLNEIDIAISFRHGKWLDDQWLVCFDVQNAPIVDIRSGNTINERIAAALVAILTLRLKKNLEELISIHGWKRLGLIFQTLDENECRKHDTPMPNFEKDFPIVISGFVKDEYRDGKFTPILVGSNYIASSDHKKYPDNRNIICLILQLINEIVAHFTRDSYSEKKLKKFRRASILEVFDVSYEPKKITK
ncbi:MAG: tetratricopeptide repeat protein [Planctomycetaceae bacterium]|nr:tetratricopeptide repeat protein [Planctomycetaceae bacterium]